MPSTAAAHEALAELFDKRSQAVAVVSGYDETIVYANDEVGRIGKQLGSEVPSLPVDFIGRSMRDVHQLYAVIDFDESAIGRCIATGELQIKRLEGDGWIAASVLPLQDVSRTVIASIHVDGLSRDDVERQHTILRSQAAMALEFAESERLIQVGMEAMHRARQRIHALRDTMLDPELLKHFPTV